MNITSVQLLILLLSVRNYLILIVTSKMGSRSRVMPKEILSVSAPSAMVHGSKSTHA